MFWRSVTSRLWMWRDAIFSLLKMSTWDCLFGSRLKLFYHWKDCLWIFVKSPSCSFVNFCLSLRVRNKDASPANRWALLFAIQEGEGKPPLLSCQFLPCNFYFYLFCHTSYRATPSTNPKLLNLKQGQSYQKCPSGQNLIKLKLL